MYGLCRRQPLPKAVSAIDLWPIQQEVVLIFANCALQRKLCQVPEKTSPSKDHSQNMKLDNKSNEETCILSGPRATVRPVPRAGPRFLGPTSIVLCGFNLFDQTWDDMDPHEMAPLDEIGIGFCIM